MVTSDKNLKLLLRVYRHFDVDNIFISLKSKYKSTVLLNKNAKENSHMGVVTCAWLLWLPAALLWPTSFR